jgi:hypothetical protein
MLEYLIIVGCVVPVAVLITGSVPVVVVVMTDSMILSLR